MDGFSEERKTRIDEDHRTLGLSTRKNRAALIETGKVIDEEGLRQKRKTFNFRDFVLEVFVSYFMWQASD